jgi:hypothetical protein
MALCATLWPDSGADVRQPYVLVVVAGWIAKADRRQRRRVEPLVAR